MGIEAHWARPVLLEVGRIQIPAFGTALVLTFFVVLQGVKHYTKTLKWRIDPETLVSIAGFAGVFGAKIHAFLLGDANLFSVTGLSFQGGGLCGFLGVSLYAFYHKVALWEFYDHMICLLVLGYALGKIACLVSGDGCYGPVSSLPWAMSFPNGLQSTSLFHHPTPIYELFVNGALSLYLWKVRVPPKRGTTFTCGLFLFGLTRFVMEFWRRHPRNQELLGFMLTEYQKGALWMMGLAVVCRVCLVWKTSDNPPVPKPIGQSVFVTKRKTN